jgi:protease PrsW
MGLLALALAPGFAICLFIYFKDKYNKEPLGLMLGTFVMGILSILPALVLQLLLSNSLKSVTGNNYIDTAIFTFLLVGISEEGSKFLALRFFAYPKKAFDDPFDGIVYAVMVSMGFATIENVGYVLQHGFGTGVLRMFLSVPAHATFGELMGYFVGLAKFVPQKRSYYFFMAMLFPVIFHGAFDYFLFLDKTGLHFLGAIVSFIVAIRLSMRAIRKKQLMSKNYLERGEIGDEGYLWKK